MAVRPIRLDLVVAGCSLTMLSIGVFTVVAASRYDQGQERISVKSASAAALSAPLRETDEEMEQRLKWHWAAINKCQAKGLHAVMGFNDEVICLDPGAWAWVYNGKGPP